MFEYRNFRYSLQDRNGEQAGTTQSEEKTTRTNGRDSPMPRTRNSIPMNSLRNKPGYTGEMMIPRLNDLYLASKHTATVRYCDGDGHPYQTEAVLDSDLYQGTVGRGQDNPPIGENARNKTRRPQFKPEGNTSQAS